MAAAASEGARTTWITATETTRDGPLLSNPFPVSPPRGPDRDDDNAQCSAVETNILNKNGTQKKSKNNTTLLWTRNADAVRRFVSTLAAAYIAAAAAAASRYFVEYKSSINR